MFLSDSRKCPGIKMPPGTWPKPSRRLEADVHELWSGLPKGEQQGTGICHRLEVFQKKHIQHGQDVGECIVRCVWGCPLHPDITPGMSKSKQEEHPLDSPPKLP